MDTELNQDSLIDEKVIEACEMAGACNEGLDWLRKKPRTYVELREKSLSWLAWMAWMASHKNYPATLELLAKDANTDVRRGVAQNASTPTATLELLAKDANADVRWGAKSTKK